MQRQLNVRNGEITMTEIISICKEITIGIFWIFGAIIGIVAVMMVIIAIIEALRGGKLFADEDDFRED